MPFKSKAQQRWGPHPGGEEGPRRGRGRGGVGQRQQGETTPGEGGGAQAVVAGAAREGTQADAGAQGSQEAPASVGPLPVEEPAVPEPWNEKTAAQHLRTADVDSADPAAIDVAPFKAVNAFLKRYHMGTKVDAWGKVDLTTDLKARRLARAMIETNTEKLWVLTRK